MLRQSASTVDRGASGRNIVRFVVMLVAVAVPALAMLLTFVGLVQDDVGGVQGLDGVVSLAVSPDGNDLYAVGSGDNALAVFDRNPSDGTLAFREVHVDGVAGVQGLNTPMAVAVSPDGVHVMVASILDDSLAVFRRNPATGSLDFVNVYQDGVGGIFGLDGANDVAVSSDGSLVFVTGEVDDTVAVFSRDPGLDDLVLADVEQNGVAGVQNMNRPTSVGVSPDNHHIYVTADLDQSVVVFTRDATQDEIAFTADVETPVSPSSVTLDWTGEHAYVAGGDWLRVYIRNPGTGLIVPTALYIDGVDGVDGLAGANAVVVTPVGRAAFASGSVDNAVAEFSRNSSSGLLDYLDVIRDGVGGVNGLDNARGIAVSPDSRFLYVAGMDDDAIAIFEIGPPIFTDGFESGDTSAWSATVP